MTLKGVGQGHGSNTPNLPLIREILEAHVGTQEYQRMTRYLEPGTRVYRMGKARIFVSPPYEDRGWHLSISREDRYPSWDEIAKAWYELVPDAQQRMGALLLPPLEEYINLHNLCMQVSEVMSGVFRMEQRP